MHTEKKYPLMPYIAPILAAFVLSQAIAAHAAPPNHRDAAEMLSFAALSGTMTADGNYDAFLRMLEFRVLRQSADVRVSMGGGKRQISINQRLLLPGNEADLRIAIVDGVCLVRLAMPRKPHSFSITERAAIESAIAADELQGSFFAKARYLQQYDAFVSCKAHYGY